MKFLGHNVKSATETPTLHAIYSKVILKYARGIIEYYVALVSTFQMQRHHLYIVYLYP